MNDNDASTPRKPARRPPWNKGKIIGAKPPLRQGQVWSIRTRLQLERRFRDLALFNLAIDSKLRGCDVVAVRVHDVAASGYTSDRATVRRHAGTFSRAHSSELPLDRRGSTLWPRLHADGNCGANVVFSRA